MHRCDVRKLDAFQPDRVLVVGDCCDASHIQLPINFQVLAFSESISYVVSIVMYSCKRHKS